MSVRITAQVWDYAPYTGTRKLVLLAFADAANQEGLCWPSIQTIARMAKCSARRVQEHLAVLIGDDWIERKENPGHSNWYVVHVPEKLQRTLGMLPPAPDEDSRPDEREAEGCEISQGSAEDASNDAEGCEISQGGVRNLAGGGAKSRRGGVRNLAPRTVSEPSLNRKRTGGALIIEKKDEEETPEPDTLSPLSPSPSSDATEEWEPGDIPAAQLWGGVIDYLKSSTPRAQIASWIAPAWIARYGWDADGVLRIELHTAGRAHADILDQRYGYLISDAVSRRFNISASHVHVSYNHAPFNSPAPQVTRREVRA